MKFKISKLNINAKMLTYILGSTIIVFLGIIWFVTYQSRQGLMKEAYSYIEEASSSEAHKIETTFNNALTVARTTSQALVTMQTVSNVDRSVALDMMKSILEKNPKFVACWVLFEPNAFDGKDTANVNQPGCNPSGRFVPYISRSTAGNITVDIDNQFDKTETLADYYVIPLTTGEEYVTEPYDFIVQGNHINMVSFCIPVKKGGQVIGVCGVDMSLKSLTEQMADVKFYETGYGFILSQKSKVVAHRNKDLVNKNYFDLSAENKERDIIANLKDKDLYTFEKTSSATGLETYYAAIKIKFGNSKQIWAFSSAVPIDEAVSSATRIRYLGILFGLIGLGLLVIIIYAIAKNISKPIISTTETLKKVSQGDVSEEMKIAVKTEDEIGQMSSAVNKLIDGLRETANFAKEIGGGNLEAAFIPLSEKDVLGNSLIDMRVSLKMAKEEEIKRKQEDDRRNWATEGFARFGEILRQNNDNIEVLGFNIIKNLVQYTKSNQGGLFVLNDENRDNMFLELVACFAYDRQKFIQKQILIGEGLVGACYQEKGTIFLSDIPDSYMDITSGLGEANPKCVLIVPLKLNELVYGVIEIASFKELEPFEIEFVEKIAESIASTMSSVKVNIRTAQLLEISQQQSEEMRAQEEEMRQNMEEMHATQEEMGRKSAEMDSIAAAIDASVGSVALNQDEKILKVNDIAANIMSSSRYELLGKFFKSYLGSDIDNINIHEEAVITALSGTANKVHYFIHTSIKDKTEVSVTYNPIKNSDGYVDKVLLAIVNISELKKMKV